MTGVLATTSARAGFTVIELAGAVTAATLLPLQARLAELLREPQPRLVIDLSRVEECDSTGATMFTVIAAVAAECGGELRMAAPTSAVGRSLRAVGTLRTYGSVEGALRGDGLDLLDQQPTTVNRGRGSGFGMTAHCQHR